MINILEHSSGKYAPRTFLNTRLGDITTAFYADRNTGGERMTKKMAGSKYVGIHIDTHPPNEVVKTIYKAMVDKNAHSLNIAGNGMYTLHKFGYDQQYVNEYVLNIVKRVHIHRPIKEIYSGGQTGIDLAGIVAAKVLKINAIATLPKGYIQRFEDKVDVVQSRKIIEHQIEFWSSKFD